MRWGLPKPEMAYDTRWYVRELRSKNDKEFDAYLALFTRHLCEPEMQQSSTYADGIPKEGMVRSAVLYRIGIMSLISKKVEEFAMINGDWSEKSKRPIVPPRAGEVVTPTSESEKKKDDDFNPDKEKDTASSESENEEDKKPKDPDVENDHRLSNDKNRKQSFMFNIADSGFTELHTLWNTEEVAAIKSGQLKEIWHRMHDYWLLAGVAKHGYARWTDIQQDPQFSLVQQPFLAMEKSRDNVLDMQKGFLQRRFKLLETALIIEEQLRRANMERCQVNEEKDTLNLVRHFNELECLAESHASIAKEIGNGNKLNASMLHRCLQRLDELLQEMKTDLMKLPVAVAQLPTIQNRLEMNERFIVAHLLTASANLEEKIDDNESSETKQQREQFKEIAKNPQVARALRFVNDNGPFCLGTYTPLKEEVEIKEENCEEEENKNQDMTDEKEEVKEDKTVDESMDTTEDVKKEATESIKKEVITIE